MAGGWWLVDIYRHLIACIYHTGVYKHPVSVRGVSANGLRLSASAFSLQSRRLSAFRLWTSDPYINRTWSALPVLSPE
jgi:hypothetical protein